ncbi:hypothetical protein [Plantactinospora sp. B5E13]|uniref:hypothetical protein n=1 Tax=unclassified Plantactinospora TaxID=2631981 RepID=UPI00325CF240
MGASGRRMDGEGNPVGQERGPESVRPWGTTGGTVDRDPPWGAGEDSPLDEGSEQAGLPPARRGERRAGPEGAGMPGVDGEPPEGPLPWSPESGRHGFGSVEPSRVPEAGPGGAPPDPAPARNPFPDDSGLDDLRGSPLEEQTGMRSEGVSRRE